MVIDESLSLDLVIDKLNEILEHDRAGISDLFLNKKSPCNEELANHPTVQVWGEGGSYSVAILGILNGLFGVFDDGPKKGFGGITMEVIVEKSIIIGFGRTKNE